MLRANPVVTLIILANMNLKLSRSLLGLWPCGEYEIGACVAPAAPVEPGVCGRTPLGVFGATRGDDDKLVL